MKRILVIEDEQPVRANIADLLDAEGYEVITATDGVDGLQKTWDLQPDLVLCDIRMPRLDGFGVLATLSRNEQTSSIPFIFLTARVERHDQRKGMELGADDYITKPFSRIELLNAVEKRLKKRETLMALTQQQVNELRSRVSDTLPYQLVAPISVILGYSEYLMKQNELLQTGQIQEISRDIHRSAQRLLHFIQNDRSYHELDLLMADPKQMEQIRQAVLVYPKAAAQEIAVIKADEYQRSNDLVTRMEDWWIQISETHFQRIIEELVDNAFKFSLENSPVCLEGIADLEHKCYHIRVVNQGVSLTLPQNIELTKNGFGMGLILVKRLVALYGGTIEISAPAGGETCVSITLPMSPSNDAASFYNAAV